MSEHPAFTMSALCAVGGLIGYAKTGSIPSAVAGVAFSALYGVSGKMIKENKDYGHEAAAIASFVLAGVQAPRAIRLQKPVPIALGSAALLTGFYYAKKVYEFKHGV